LSNAVTDTLQDAFGDCFKLISQPRICRTKRIGLFLCVSRIMRRCHCCRRRNCRNRAATRRGFNHFRHLVRTNFAAA
jgi:hypothetical protein